MGKKLKRMQPINWFPRVVVYACTTVEDAKRLAKKHAKCEFEDTGHEATTGLYVDGLDIMAVVMVKGFDNSAQKVALLAHECSHVAGEFLDNLGEESNDSEFRSYVVQSVMLACLDQLGYGESDS